MASEGVVVICSGWPRFARHDDFLDTKRGRSLAFLTREQETIFQTSFGDFVLKNRLSLRSKPHAFFQG